MANIIQFGKRADDLRSERETVLRQRKIDALKKIFQCTRCLMKCSKCGSQIEHNAEEPAKFAAPYAFCNSCQSEYEEYRARSAGASDSTCYWHNSGWMRVWESWLGHQKALDEYRQTKEFLQLMDEVEGLLRK
ncbi:MAG: hypothetical protein AAGU11_19640 [Syntrophobacteraceae bacterium]